ncbi:lysM and putative peptidoglycan-binding domain-containing protein 2-like [Mytilus edulis]|uniref:lysM and putative peptidoglycan-binding domain-containing protein 2-like n=1 Tax=Mytilus edulis TaxID=6550 RepID=UPI0039F0DED9
MAEGGGEEKQFLGKLVRNQTKYGTNSRLTQKNSTYIKHSIVKGDTLQGISLKYGTTVEQIKRENQLWTNDSLFLREHLLIPVQNEDVSSIPDRYETVVIDPVSRTRSASQKSNTSAKSNESEKNVPKDSSSSSSSSQKAAANGESGMDFLSKYDTSIAQLKSNVNKMEKNARSLPNNVIDNDFTYRRKSSSQRSANSINSNIRKSSFDSNGQLPSFYDNDGFSGSDKDLTSSPVLVIKSKSSTRRVKTSLDRIARQNDEIFEL